MTNAKKTDMAESVMAKITTDNICIKSKSSIVVGSIAMGMGLGLLVAVTVIIASLVIHQLIVWAPFGYLWFGMLGFTPFLQTLPWVWIGLSTILIFAGYSLLKHYDFSYKTGYQGILLVFCVTVFGMAFAVEKIGIHQRMSQQPLLRQVYFNSTDPDHWMSGEIVIASQSGVVIMTPNQHQIVVHISKSTRLPAGSNFQPGVKVQTIGSFVDDLFEADGIRF